ncbi:MAG: cation:dicarboxylate symporter family transporter, partial [Gemmatimonadota bacterium]
MAADAPRRGIPLHTKILLGLFLGALAGVTANLMARNHPTLLWIVDNIAYPVGQVFLRLLFMIVVPLIFTSISLGVASLGDLGKVGRIGGKTLGFFLATTGLA